MKKNVCKQCINFPLVKYIYVRIVSIKNIQNIFIILLYSELNIITIFMYEQISSIF